MLSLSELERLFLTANKIGALFISAIKLEFLDMALKLIAIRLNTFKYFSTLSPIEFHNLCDDFTSNSANSIGDGSSLTPQPCRNLLALAPKLMYEKKSFKLK